MEACQYMENAITLQRTENSEANPHMDMEAQLATKIEFWKVDIGSVFEGIFMYLHSTPEEWAPESLLEGVALCLDIGVSPLGTEQIWDIMQEFDAEFGGESATDGSSFLPSVRPKLQAMIEPILKLGIGSPSTQSWWLVEGLRSLRDPSVEYETISRSYEDCRVAAWRKHRIFVYDSIVSQMEEEQKEKLEKIGPGFRSYFTSTVIHVRNADQFIDVGHKWLETQLRGQNNAGNLPPRLQQAQAELQRSIMSLQQRQHLQREFQRRRQHMQQTQMQAQQPQAQQQSQSQPNSQQPTPQQQQAALRNVQQAPSSTTGSPVTSATAGSTIVATIEEPSQSVVAYDKTNPLWSTISSYQPNLSGGGSNKTPGEFLGQALNRRIELGDDSRKLPLFGELDPWSGLPSNVTPFDSSEQGRARSPTWPKLSALKDPGAVDKSRHISGADSLASFLSSSNGVPYADPNQIPTITETSSGEIPDKGQDIDDIQNIIQRYLKRVNN
ncbi:hypothetical protein ABW20_dc0103939 [Dactylellina cionopaga]|nr:hypothetical protein ABW20_dc0103939 [Dactylellina cionopaga]